MKPYFLVADFETYWAPDYTLSKMTTESYIRDARFKAHGCGLKLANRDAVWVTGNKLRWAFDQINWDNVYLIGHNLQFDATILAWRYGKYPRGYIDTLGMSRALIGQHNIRHGLHYMAPTLTGLDPESPWSIGQSGLLEPGLHKMDGLAQTLGIVDLPDWREKILADYCVKPPHYNPKTQRWEAGDCDLTWESFKRMAPHFPHKEFGVLNWTIEKFAKPKLFMDDELLASYLQWVKDDKIAALQRAGLTDRTSLMSGPKYAAALEAYGVVPPTKINNKGKVTYAFAKTDEAHKALLEHDNPSVQALVAARLAVKSTIEETRATAYLEASTRGAWPVGYSYSGAINTHRFSGNKGGGGNPMNLKRGGTLRDCIYAPEGYVCLVFDLSQIECRLALWCGTFSSKTTGMERESLDMMARGDKAKKDIEIEWKRLKAAGLHGSAELDRLKKIKNESDLYSFFASMMYGRTITPENKDERQGGKSAVLGLGFGMGPDRYIDYNLTLGNRIDASFAESTVHLYRNTYKGLRAMWKTWERAFKAAVQQGEQWTVANARVVKDPIFGSWSFQIGDNLLVKYPDLTFNEADRQWTYRDGKTIVKMFGGKWMENYAQYSGRVILTDKLMEIEQTYECAMTTYDELVALVENTPEAIEQAIEHCYNIITREHPLFPGLPLGCEYGHHQRYGQAKH